MARQLLMSAVLLCSAMVVPSLAQTETTHVCPHFWHNQILQPDGSFIYEWYSEHLHKDGTTCTSLKWDNWVGGEDEPTGGGCQNLDACIGLEITSDSKVPVRSTREFAKSGLQAAHDPDYEPTVSAAVTVIDRRIVDVMITPDKVIKAKLYLKIVDPRAFGKSFPSIIVASGFEVVYKPQYPPYFTVPNSDVTRIGANLYDVKIGQVVYQVITSEES